MRFRVLGPLSVQRDGEHLSSLSPLMMRRLLAALLSRANECVPVDELVLALWGEDVPPSARGTLRVYIRRLRSALGDDRRITKEPAGYRVVIHSGELDAAEFAGLVDQSRSAGPERRSALLAQALELWRGRAYEDVRDNPPLADEAYRLDEERLRVAAWHAELRLELGEHAELVPHLTKLIEADPFREDLRRHLMLALYRCGRQTDALTLFHDTRRLLAEEIGIDPGPELCEMHEAILRADPSLHLPIRRRPEHPAPRQLPADIYGFVGRVEQLEALDHMASDSAPVVISALAGSAGVGKTALAVHWAHKVTARFPDGQLYINLRGFDPVGTVMAPAEAIHRFLDALNVPAQRIPADPGAQADLYRTMLADKRMLVVLDNARDPDHVRPLLPGAPGCRVLVTSRHRLTGLIASEGARLLPLDLLTFEEARDLLARRLGTDRVTAEPDAVDELITCCARLPLALAIVAAHAATNPHLSLATLADQLRHSHNRIDTLSTGDTAATDVRAVFSWSYQTLSEASARLFRLLGLHPGPDISVHAAASLAALPSDRVRSLLDELVGAHLITEHNPGRYTFHDLLRAYAADLAQTNEPAAERDAAIHRMFDHYLHSADTAARVLEPNRDLISLSPPRPGTTPEHPTVYQKALDWFTAEHPVLRAVVDHAAAAGFDTHTWQLAWTLRTFLDRQGHWRDYAAVQQAAVAAAMRLADPITQARAHRYLARGYTRLGRFDEAHTQLRHALDLDRQADHLTGQADTYLSLAVVWGKQGRVSEALTNALQSLDFYRAADHRNGQALCLNAVGWYHAHLGDHQHALTYCKQAFTLFQELGNRDGQAATWDSIGYAHHHLGHHAQAIACFQHALRLFQDLGDRHEVARTLTNLGDAYHAAGNPQDARQAWQQALTILDQLDHLDADKIRTKLADLHTTSPEVKEEDRKAESRDG